MFNLRNEKVKTCTVWSKNTNTFILFRMPFHHDIYSIYVVFVRFIINQLLLYL